MVGGSCLLSSCPLGAGVQALWGCPPFCGAFPAFCPLYRSAVVALLANMALFRVFRGFLGGFIGFVWVCATCALCVACGAFVCVSG